MAGKLSHDRVRDYEALVQAYLESDTSLADLADRAARSDADALGVMSNMLHAFEESPLKEREQLVVTADRMDLRDFPPEFAVLFASVWCEFLHRKGERERFYSVLRFAQSLCRPAIDPRIASEISMLSLLAPSGRGRESQMRSLSRERLAAWRDHPRAWRVYRDTGYLLAARGARDAFTECQAAMAEGAGDRMRATIAWLDLIDAGIRGDVPAGRRAIDATQQAMAQDADLATALARGFRLARHELNVVAAVLDGSEPEARIAEERAWMPAMRDLLRGDLDRAVQRARALSSTGANAATEDLDVTLGAYQRIRAELCAGHPGAAARLLLQRQARGTRHFVDDVILARLELATGDRGDAARLMARAAAAAERQGAFGRIAFELALARELNGAQLALLCRIRPAPRIVSRGDTRPIVRPAAPRRGCDRLVGTSDAAQRMRDQIFQFADAAWPVLISGETGTGKELVARALHEAGDRAGEPFIAVNCAAVPSNLFEDELFGHARGAFTGAVGERQGLFALAGRGTLFFDEVGELAPDLQPKLLRVLESRQFRPIGGTAPVDVHCRILAATNRSLAAQVAAGEFRQDLYYRFIALEVTLPALRERGDDRFELLRHFYAEGAGGTMPPMTPEFEAAVAADDWPGNVRELRHFVERLKILSADTPSLTLQDFLGARQRRAERVAPGALRTAPPRRQPSRPVPGHARPAARQPRFRRLEQLRELFETHRRLTRNEIAGLLDVADSTAGRDLKALLADGVIRKVRPNASPRSHYFEYVAPVPAQGS